MSVNQSHAINQKKTKHLGKYFPTIDFNVNYASKGYLESYGNQAVIGNLQIQDREHKITLGQVDDIITDIYHSNQLTISGYSYKDMTRFELERVIETLKAAKVVFFQKYRFGI